MPLEPVTPTLGPSHDGAAYLTTPELLAAYASPETDSPIAARAASVTKTELVKRLADAQFELDTANGTVSRLRRDLSEISASLDSRTLDLASARSELSEIKTRLQSVSLDAEAAERHRVRAEHLTVVVAGLEEELAALRGNKRSDAAIHAAQSSSPVAAQDPSISLELSLLRRANESMSSEQHDFEAKISRLMEELTRSRGDCALLRTRLDAEQADRRRAAEEAVKDFDAAIEKRTNALKAQVDRLWAELTTQRESTASFVARAVEAETSPLRPRLAQLEKEVATAKAEAETARVDADASRRELCEAKAALDAERDRSLERQGTVLELKEQLRALREELRCLESQLTEAARIHSRQKQQLVGQQQEISRLSSHVDAVRIQAGADLDRERRVATDLSVQVAELQRRLSSRSEATARVRGEVAAMKSALVGALSAETCDAPPVAAPSSPPTVPPPGAPAISLPDSRSPSGQSVDAGSLLAPFKPALIEVRPEWIFKKRVG
jgi:chromosome segregation ATPase